MTGIKPIKNKAWSKIRAMHNDCKPRNPGTNEKTNNLGACTSDLSFIKIFVQNSLDSDGFIIRNAYNQNLTYDSLVVQTDHITKYLKYKGIAKIYYYSKSTKTTIQLQKDSVYFDKLGYYDPLGINWWRYGEMTNQRMGDLLPFDYKYK